MDQAQFWIISIIGPAILLIVLLWLVMRGRSNRPPAEGGDGTEAATRDLYAEEEQRRREGTDEAEK